MTIAIAYPLPHLGGTVIGADSRVTQDGRIVGAIEKSYQTPGFVALSSGNLGQIQRVLYAYEQDTSIPLSIQVAEYGPDTEWLLVDQYGIGCVDGDGGGTMHPDEAVAIGCAAERALGYLAGLGHPTTLPMAEKFVLAAMEYVAETYTDVGPPYVTRILEHGVVEKS